MKFYHIFRHRATITEKTPAGDPAGVLLFRGVFFFAEVQFLHALHLIADGFQGTGAAVGGHTL